jgi:hypothetical protein
VNALGTNNISVIDTQVGKAVGPPIVESSANAIAIVPDQPPLASVSNPRARPGVPVVLNASASGDPDGTIAGYAWSLGDGQTASGGPSLSHTYDSPGTYQVTLTLTDNEGCSTSLVFTGQTAYCNGGPGARVTQTVTVSYPGVRLNCPKRAKRGGCKFKLQVVSKKRKGKAESAVARGKAKAGHSAVVSLRPKKAFAAKLAAAKKVLLRETMITPGSARTSYPRLKIVR